jgi:hypothetical protein
MYGKSSPSTIVLGPPAGTAIVNDGAWHHIVLNLWFAPTIEQQCWVDGVKQWGDGGSAGNFNTNINGRFARSNDGFWDGYVGKIAEVAIWGGPSYGAYLTPDAIKSLSQGIDPRSCYLRDMHAYMPLRYDVKDLLTNVAGQPFTSGGSFVEDHPRIFR